MRLVPGPYNLVFRERLLRGLLEVLERERILTIVELPTLGVPVPDKEDVLLGALEEILDRHPRLALLTCGRLRNFYPLLERFPRLLTSLAWDPHPDFVEDFCRRFGARRLLFATPHSENAREVSGMPMLQVTHAGVGEAEKAQVAGLNLAELLGVELPPRAPGAEPPGRPEFRELLAGRPSPFPIVDIHAHVGAWNWEHKPGSTLSDLLPVMDRLGVERVCVNSTEAVLGGDHFAGNEELSAALRGREGRFTGLRGLQPALRGAGGLPRALRRGPGLSGHQDPPPGAPLRHHRREVPPRVGGRGQVPNPRSLPHRAGAGLQRAGPVRARGSGVP